MIFRQNYYILLPTENEGGNFQIEISSLHTCHDYASYEKPTKFRNKFWFKGITVTVDMEELNCFLQFFFWVSRDKWVYLFIYSR